ncbi:hypothetical protein BDB01DRAFT_774577 [Pilobolus umbonatus]|nr:hypothetical protein BDB01DRAFT_774577 [Pilobolus umbonatus]
MSHLSFEHFNPEIELGNLDTNGRPIRPKKKPGRKPNPPSPAQRKAQNRAAQRAFRERKRREMLEAEITVKRCIHARDKTLRENKRLKRRIDELTYETNYLKGYVLTLKMACIANHVEVPKIWDNGTKDEIGAERLTYSKTKGIPQQLEFFLDKKLNIITIDQHQTKGQTDMRTPSSPISKYIIDDSPAMSKRSSSPLSSSSESSYTSDAQDDTMSVNSSLVNEESTSERNGIPNSALSSIVPKLASHLESPFFQQLLNTNLVGSYSPDNNHATMDPSSSAMPRENTKTSRNSSICSNTSAGFFDASIASELSDEDMVEDTIVDAKTGMPRTTTAYTGERDFRNKGHHAQILFPPMTPLDAIEKMRDVQNLGTDARALFVPTELQRTIRHDTRIDVVPGAAMRDHMILFQDYYDANELFDYLAENSVFLGGELGNPDSWFVPPSFLKRYWFLCPNHKRQRMDNAVEIMVKLGKRMLELILERKQMYIKRELYPDYFPEPTPEEMDAEFLAKDDHEHLHDIFNRANELFPMDEEMIDSNLFTTAGLDDTNDLSHEVDFMSLINSMPNMSPEFTV